MANKTVFILGAGASVDAGAPLMSNFFDISEDIFGKKIGLKKNEIDSIKNVFELIQKSMSSYANSNIDLNNIETIFGLLEMASIVNRFHDYSQNEILERRNDLIRLIVTTLEHSTRINSSVNRFYSSESYNSLCSLIRNGGVENNTVITFNYDMAFEAAFTMMHEEYYIDYGFEYFKTRHYSRKSLPFYKLHGSINWFENNANKDLSVLDITGIHRFDKFQTYVKDIIARKQDKNLSIAELRELFKNHEDFRFLNESSDTPFIIPPSWNKSAYHKSVSHIWEKAVQAIAEASHIVIIGYSLPESDLFFKYLYTIGTLQNSRIRSFNVFDPNHAVQESYKKMLGNGILKRFNFFQEDFSEAVRRIGEEKFEIWMG